MNFGQLKKDLVQQQQQPIDLINYYYQEYFNNKKLSGNWKNKAKITFGEFLNHKITVEQIAVQEETKQVLIGILDIMGKDFNKRYGKIKTPIEEEEDDYEEDEENDEDNTPKHKRRK